MAKFGAQGALLASGEKVQLVVPTGKRYASQTTPHESLVKLVKEIVPANTQLNLNGGTTFAYAFNGSAATVRVDAAISTWRVGLEVKPIEAPSAEDERAAGFPAETAPAPPTPGPPPAPKPAPPPPSYANVQVDSAIEKLLLKMLELGA